MPQKATFCDLKGACVFVTGGGSGMGVFPTGGQMAPQGMVDAVRFVDWNISRMMSG